MRIVALGGGHGLYATLTALRGLTDHLTAIVTVADDGGSSGRLRDELGVLPPGDLRMALSALCEDTEWGRTWRDVLQSRFVTEGPLHGHALGNLLIAALWDKTGDVVEGLDWIGRLLRSEGRVLPLAGEPLQIAAMVATDNGELAVTGQVAVATAPGRITSLSISPTNPRVPAETVAAIDQADLVVLGPGSWYTSVLVHFLVEPVANALGRAQDRTVLALNIAYEDEETAGTDRVDDVRALRTLAPDYVPSVVLADVGHGDDPRLKAEVAAWGAHLAVASLCASGTVDRHDIASLREQYLRAAEQFA
ncbi:MAG: hypothetical protein CVT64_06290 [Actinobacteria bacterium HGW-Actinobacteria-4]|nr:MAG: hypothetical protein CVT64_06290 [Actinobacteria bacterium HGW-Actinobacteria-4]